jgi:flagellar protein FliL
MNSILIPMLFLVLGTVGGIAAAKFLQPSVDAKLQSEVGTEHAEFDSQQPGEKVDASDENAPDAEYVRLNNQFVVPVVLEGKVSSLVVLSLSLEISPAIRDTVFEREPKLRDAFLQVLFDHANLGGFTGNFTNIENLTHLKTTLLEVARRELGTEVSGILIESMARQDV